ncbi:amidohydrolase family protein [Aliiroseovarius subalbicans]|uniref:amidohydrolase family protein n=1 Tax=Aliiroseovarius subalbicans TaxID=2925840 RepID=UPI001F58814E|nr:amidohydrolase family protein [Aliiroseovarius subalbicans]MCI2401122.1 amidohydrolase family protein [Aliiroseovarius subalbicans]
MIDAHHHLWDLGAVHYPWLMARGVRRFFGDPAPIQRDYLLDEFRAEAGAQGITGSVHIQVGAEDGLSEAKWVHSVAEANPDWPIKQVVFCDLTAPDLNTQLDTFQSLSTVVGVRQIVGRAPEEDAATGTNDLLDNPKFAEGLREAGAHNLSFDLQLIPELMEKTAHVLKQAPDTRIALCHAGSPHDRSALGLADWAEQLQHLSALPQVYCKLSGLGMFDHNWTPESIQKIVETCLEQFGPHRCMFGSNFPVDKLYSEYGTIIAAYRKIVPQGDYERVFQKSAAEFYAFS